MFPYNEKPISKLRTSSDIEKFGQQTLLRALNIGRVVAFVGSGTSLKFGQPTWEAFAERGIKLFFTLETVIIAHPKWQAPNSAFWKDFRETLTPLVNEIKELRSCRDFLSSHLIELIEDYFAEVCPLLKEHNVEFPSWASKFNVNKMAELRKKAIAHFRPKELPSQFSTGGPSETKEEWAAWEEYHFGPDIESSDEFKDLARNVSDFRRVFATQFNSRDSDKQLKASSEFTKLLGELDLGVDDQIEKLDKIKLNITKIDAARTLRRRLGVRRYLTLNYDLELELMLFEEGRATPLDAYKNFEDFLLQESPAKNRKLPYEPGRAVTLQSPSGRVVRSSSSRRETLADLFSFGAFPTNYDASVHHLHGRIDDPDNMIITPKDYQRIYYGASDQKKSFDEARHAVFTGSDILVLGLGTKEHDVLKPLRDFLEIEADRRDAHGKVYYITATEFSGKETSLAKAHKAARKDAMAKTQHLYKDYGMHTLFIDQSFDTERTRSWTSQNATLFAARAEIANYLQLVGQEEEISLWDETVLKKDFAALFAKMKSFPPGRGKSSEEIRLKPMAEVIIARKLATKWNALGGAFTKQDQSDIKDALKALDSHLRDQGLVQYAQRLEHARQAWWSDWSEFPGLRIAALGPHNYKLKKVSNPKDHAKDPKFEVDDTDASFPIVWKQTNLAAHISAEPAVLGDPSRTPQFTGLVMATGKARAAAQAKAKNLTEKELQEINQAPPDQRRVPRTFPTVFPASVARISIPPGGGKGRLLSYFTSVQKLDISNDKNTTKSNKKGAKSGKKEGTSEDEKVEVWPFQTLFDAIQASNSAEDFDMATPYEGYKACFMSHLTFALEFSGTMIAFARLLQQLLFTLRKELEEDPEAYNDPDWEHLLKHQFHTRASTEPCIKVLRRMFDLLQRTCPERGWETRMVAIFSYLDRLVDSESDAYAPTHRAFFRLISGWNDPAEHMRLPVDFIFINCHADQPIRYLSTERLIKRRKDERRHPRWQQKKWKLRHDRKVALEHWTELPRVRPRIIFLEALEHAAGITPINAGSFDAQVAHAKEVADALGIPDREEVTKNPDLENDFLDLPSGLKKFMYRRVANGYFIAGLANTVWYKAKGNRDAFRKEWKRCLSALDIAFAREKSRGFIDELFSIYRRLDRTFPNSVAGIKKARMSSRMGSELKSRNLERLRTMMIDHLALLQVPVTASTLEACPDVKSVAQLVVDDQASRSRRAMAQGTEERSVEVVTQELDLLVARGLASRYGKFSDRLIESQKDQTLSDTDKRYVYVLNTKIANVLRARANLQVYSQYRLMVFQPNVYPSQPERALKPDISHFERVSAVVRALVKHTHRDLVSVYWKMREGEHDTEMDDAAFAARMETHNDKLRAAYALIRGTFSISVIARLAEGVRGDKRIAPFDEYRTWTRKLLNTATLLSKIRELDMEKRLDPTKGNDQKDPIPYNHPFLRDEISWLYNERALVSFVQGRLFDALPLFEQARVMLGNSPQRSSPQSEDSTHRRIQMNFALAQIERGNIVTAQEALGRIVVDTGERWQSDTPSVIHCMATGYIGLSHHLTNEFTRAQDGYERVLKDIGQFNHPRAESIFRRHYADLLRTMSTSRNDPEYKEAISQLRSSEELALGIRATDLHHYAIMAQARLHRDMHERGQALEKLRQVEEYARAMGIQKMFCEVLKVRGEVLLAEGETTQAGFVTAQSIAISKRNGMRLRKISAAIIQTQILRERNQIRDAERLLRETISESQTLGYATKTSQALSLLND